MKFVLNLSTILFVTFGLTGCGWIYKSTLSHNKDKSYLYARSIPPLKIPPGITSDKFHAKYPISDRQYPAITKDISLVPPSLYD